MLQGEKKFRELILYLSLRSEGDPYFGSTKLNKLLFYSDFLAYRELGHSISGRLYRALPFGPVPDKMDRFMSQLEKVGAIVFRTEDFYGRPQKRPLCLEAPDIKAFAADELALVDMVLERFKQMNATQLSEASHQFLGWDLAEQGEAIPYGVALLARGELTNKELAHARKLEKRASEWLASRGS